MDERFYTFVTDISAIYKSIQKIKKYDMKSIGLKTSHVMCLNSLSKAGEGLTAAQLCTLTGENKAGISRSLAELEKRGYITYCNTTVDSSNTGKRKYRARAVLTPDGRSYAEKVVGMADHAVKIGSRGLTDEDREVLYRVLASVSENLEKYCSVLEEESK